MVDLAEGLEAWVKQIKTVTDLSVTSRSKITGAGADAYSEVLKKNTPRSKSNHHTHIADEITFKPGWTSDRLFTGDTSVGWKNNHAAMIAQFVNDGAGTISNKRIANMHFKDKSDLEAKEIVLRAEMMEYKKVIHSDGGK